MADNFEKDVEKNEGILQLINSSNEIAGSTSSDEMMKCCWVNSCYLCNRQLAYWGEIKVLT